MGTYLPEYVIVETYSVAKGEQGKQARAIAGIESFIRNQKAKDRKLFFKCDPKMNCQLTYLMCWDGSKEGWERSDHCDVLRAKFISLAKKLEGGPIKHVHGMEIEQVV